MVVGTALAQDLFTFLTPVHCRLAFTHLAVSTAPGFASFHPFYYQRQWLRLVVSREFCLDVVGRTAVTHDLLAIVTPLRRRLAFTHLALCACT